MGRQRHTAEEIINRLREAEIGLAKGLAVSPGSGKVPITFDVLDWRHSTLTPRVTCEILTEGASYSDTEGVPVPVLPSP